MGGKLSSFSSTFCCVNESIANIVSVFQIKQEKTRFWEAYRFAM